MGCGPFTLCLARTTPYSPILLISYSVDRRLAAAQRCHDPNVLQDRCVALGVPMEPLQAYIDSFRHGCSPHGGVGLGLERIVQMYLDLDNIRKAVFFSRDPVRLTP